MADFGFTIPKNRHIDLDKADTRLYDFVNKHEASVNLCISCGACTATCTTGALTAYNTRRMNLLLKWGELDSVKDQIDKCVMCGKCLLVCPRGVQTRNVIMRIKQGLKKLEDNVL